MQRAVQTCRWEWPCVCTDGYGENEILCSGRGGDLGWSTEGPRFTTTPMTSSADAMAR